MPELATLFATSRNTRRCWCMAPCVSGFAFGVGWVTKSNQRRFAAMAADSPSPWACWRRSPPDRWAVRDRPSLSLRRREHLQGERRDGDGGEDDAVWLVPCFFVHPAHRSRGVTHALLRAAIELARTHGATAIEGRPPPGPEPRRGDAFKGRESLFTDLGFTHTESPDARPVVMRLELA